MVGGSGGIRRERGEGGRELGKKAAIVLLHGGISRFLSRRHIQLRLIPQSTYPGDLHPSSIHFQCHTRSQMQTLMLNLPTLRQNPTLNDTDQSRPSLFRSFHVQFPHCRKRSATFRSPEAFYELLRARSLRSVSSFPVQSVLVSIRERPDNSQ